MKTKHFNKDTDKRLACPCCPNQDVLPTVYVALEMIRNHFGRPVKVTSGYRCTNYNKQVGGAPDSRHLQGLAVDVVVVGIPPKMVYNFLDHHFPDSFGLGLYNTFTHVDVRSKKARWSKC
jgi:uncharacterized protein YcbK (DUF882 family)